MRVYYAHAMSLYGTPQEQRDVTLLIGLGFEVVNPNDRHVDKLVKMTQAKWNAWTNLWPRPSDRSQLVMDEVFKPLVRGCSALAFRGLPGGKLTAGVAAEIDVAQQMGLPVFELPSFLDRRLSVDDTKRYLQEVGQR